MRTTTIAGAALTVLLALAGCSGTEEEQEPGPTVTAAPQQEAPAPPEPDLEGLPEVIAEVDGVAISREEFIAIYQRQFEQAAMQAQLAGEEVDEQALRQYTAESMVDTELLLQEAADRSLAPTEEEVTAALEGYAASAGMSTEEFLAALEEEGLDRQTALAELSEQTALDQLYAQEAGEADLSEERLRERYEAIAAQAGPDAGLPEFEEARPALEAELQREHENTAVQALVTQLRDQAQITYHW